MTAFDEPAYLLDLDVHGRSCLVVGRGFSANRRVEAMRARGAEVTLVSSHGYQRGMAGRFELVVTCDSRVDELVIADAARTAGTRIHVVGNPARSSMLLPRPHLRQLAS